MSSDTHDPYAAWNRFIGLVSDASSMLCEGRYTSCVLTAMDALAIPVSTCLGPHEQHALELARLHAIIAAAHAANSMRIEPPATKQRRGEYLRRMVTP